jgi:sortase A
MVERIKESSNPPLSRGEQLVLLSTILIWIGVIVFGVGLAVALNNLRVERAAYAELAAFAAIPTQTAVPTPTVPLYPAGWSTATPTPPPSPTPTRDQTGRQVYRSAHSDASAGALLPDPSLAERQKDALPTPTQAPPSSRHPPDRLVIPAIDLDSPVLPIGWTVVEQGGQSSRVWAVADEVVGWHKTSGYPGETGNVVLNGHHNIKGQVFRYLVDVEVGDRVLVYSGDQVYYYAVTEKHILKEKGEPIEVRRKNALWMNPTEDERVTMITCWPYTNNTHRLVVVARSAADDVPEGVERWLEP